MSWDTRHVSNLTLFIDGWLRLTCGELEATIEICTLAQVESPCLCSVCPRWYGRTLLPVIEISHPRAKLHLLTRTTDYSPAGSAIRCRDLFSQRPDLRHRPFQIIQSVPDPTNLHVIS